MTISLHPIVIPSTRGVEVGRFDDCAAANRKSVSGLVGIARRVVSRVPASPPKPVSILNHPTVPVAILGEVAHAAFPRNWLNTIART